MFMTNENGQMGLATSKFNLDIFRELWIVTIIMHDLPFQFVEYEGMGTTFNYVHFKIKFISRNTCKFENLRMYSKENVKVKSLLVQFVVEFH